MFSHVEQYIVSYQDCFMKDIDLILLYCVTYCINKLVILPQFNNGRIIWYAISKCPCQCETIFIQIDNFTLIGSKIIDAFYRNCTT